MKNNNRYIKLEFTSHGHYRCTMQYYGKNISCITNDMRSVDDYNTEEGERDGRELRQKRGYTALKNEIIRKNKTN